MINELKAIEDLGVSVSSELSNFIDKSPRNIIKQLSNLEAGNEIKIIIFHSKEARKRVYLSNEIYNNLFKIKKS